MKKVLMVLGLAMCASVAFAQTSNSARQKMICASDADRVAFNKGANDAKIDYKASIFTKDDDVVIDSFDFASNHMTGISYGQNAVITAADSNRIVGGMHELHTSASFWMRIDSTGYIGTQTFATTYPMSANYGASSIPLYLGPQNGIEVDNGFMFIPEIDAAPVVSGNQQQRMNAYFALPAVTIPAGTQIVDVDFRQFYRKFYENCFIDYKLNGTWQTVEINVTGVDVAVNGTGPAHVVVTMPLAAASQPSLELRFRAFSEGSSQVMGYMWAVDNVKIIAASTPSRWSFSNVGYLDGFYGMIPEGFNLPLAFAAYSRNRGITDHTNVKLNMEFRTDESGEGDWVLNDDYNFEVNQVNMPAGDVSKNYLLKINERGFMVDSLGFSSRKTGLYVTSNGQRYYLNEYQAQARPEFWQNYGIGGDEFDETWGLRGLPTNNPGKNQFILTATADDMESPAVFDTMTYTVSEWIDTDATTIARGITIPGYRWGHDNGVIAGGSEFSYQFTEDGYVTESGNHQYQEGYEVFVRFVTPSELPFEVDDETGDTIPWVIRGLELIPSTQLNAQDLNGVKVSPVSYYDAQNSSTGSWGMYYFNNYTGLDANASVRVNGATAANPNDTIGYFLPDEEYHAVNILFPGQPTLFPNMSFYFGYKLPQSGPFALGTQQTRYYYSTDSVAYFRNDPTLRDYANQFWPDNKQYDVYAFDEAADNAVSGLNIGEYPLVRLIVGPRMNIEDVHVSATCGEGGEEGVYWVNRSGNLCAARAGVDTIAQGSTFGYEFVPGRPEESTDEFDPYYYEDPEAEGEYLGWVIEKIFLDGVEIPFDDPRITAEDYDLVDPAHSDPEMGVVWEPLLERKTYTLFLEDIQEDHHISAIAGTRRLGIQKPYDANIKLALAPNPATSQVRLNISGVTGKVNCNILDMSGRVVYTSSFNAENAQVINLNGVPAGAYFVRITGESFSKVERLIVR